MDLLPSHEELDNTGFRVADKKSMLALIGERHLTRQRHEANVLLMLIRLTLILKICLLWPQAPIRRTAAPLLRVISPTRSSRWRGTDPSPASIARGSSYLRAWTRYHCTEPHRTSVFIRRYCAETAEISHTIWLRCGFLETVFSFMNRLNVAASECWVSLKEFVSLSPDVGPAVHEQPGELSVWKLSVFRQPAGQVSTSVFHSITRYFRNHQLLE